MGFVTRYDAVIVPGGGIREGGEVPPWVENRLEKALELAAGAPIITLSAGTTHKAPLLDASGMPIFESVAGARYLCRRGYPARLLFVENCSYDTIGNGYFTRVIHTDPAGYRDLLVITSEFHMPRTEAIFRWIFALSPIATPYRLTFLPVPDAGMTRDVLDARRAKERASLEGLRKLVAQLETLASLHRWLFTEHAAYSIQASRWPAAPGDPLLESY